jgi:hypothetical protein
LGHDINGNWVGNVEAASKQLWLPVPFIKVDMEPLNQKTRDLHNYGVILQIWGECISLSKLHKRIHAHWYGTLFLQVMSLNTFLLIMDSVDAKNKVLDKKFVWIGRNIMFIHPWCPLFKVSKPLDVLKPIWFNLPALPLEFSNPRVLEALGNSMEKFLLSDKGIVDGLFCIKICALLNPSKGFSSFCNLNSIDGIWRQPIMRDSVKFPKAAISIDAPLFNISKLNLGNFNPKVDSLVTPNKVASNSKMTLPNGPPPLYKMTNLTSSTVLQREREDGLGCPVKSNEGIRVDKTQTKLQLDSQIRPSKDNAQGKTLVGEVNHQIYVPPFSKGNFKGKTTVGEDNQAHASTEINNLEINK